MVKPGSTAPSRKVPVDKWQFRTLGPRSGLAVAEVSFCRKPAKCQKDMTNASSVACIVTQRATAGNHMSKLACVFARSNLMYCSNRLRLENATIINLQNKSKESKPAKKKMQKTSAMESDDLEKARNTVTLAWEKTTPIIL